MCSREASVLWAGFWWSHHDYAACGRSERASSILGLPGRNSGSLAALSPARTVSIPCRPWRLRDARRPASTKGRGEALSAGLLAPVWAAPPLSSALVLLCAYRTKLRARARLRRLPGEPVLGPPAAGGAGLALPAARRAARAVPGGGWRVPGCRPPGHFLGLQGGADRGGTERGPGAVGGFPAAWRPAPGSGCWSTRGDCRWPLRPSRAPPARGGAAGTFASCLLCLPSVSQRLRRSASLASMLPTSPAACSRCSVLPPPRCCGWCVATSPAETSSPRGLGAESPAPLLVWMVASELLLLPWQVAQRSPRAPSSAQALKNRASPARCSQFPHWLVRTPIHLKSSQH